MIHWSAELARRLACADDEKRVLGPLIRRFVELLRRARLEGYQSLEAEADRTEDSLLRVGLKLVSEGLSGEALEDILATYLLVADETGAAFLRSCAVAEGLLSLADGDEAALMIRKLAAYYGADRAASVLMEIEGAEP